MRLGWRHVAATVGAVAMGGLFVAWLGVIDIRASSGHWRITDWFLHWVMRSSVRTYSLGIEAPDLDNPAYLPLAAGHFEAACADCHGSPERARSPTVRAMLPPPPDLATVAAGWADEELFQIVRHGVRYTGMPAWPSARDDEVWAMVAFLREYRKLDAAAYRRLRGGDRPEAQASKVGPLPGCEACHAAPDLGGASLIPRLDGQSEIYLLESLRSFRRGDRHSGVMQTAVSILGEEDMAELARTYAARRPLRHERSTAPALVTLGDRARKIPACSSCHDRAGLNPAYPVLQGLSRDYIRSQLRLFAAGTRGGTAYRELMTRAARNLTETEMEALAHYFGSP